MAEVTQVYQSFARPGSSEASCTLDKNLFHWDGVGVTVLVKLLSGIMTIQAFLTAARGA